MGNITTADLCNTHQSFLVSSPNCGTNAKWHFRVCTFIHRRQGRKKQGKSSNEKLCVEGGWRRETFTGTLRVRLAASEQKTPKCSPLAYIDLGLNKTKQHSKKDRRTNHRGLPVPHNVTMCPPHLFFKDHVFLTVKKAVFMLIAPASLFESPGAAAEHLQATVNRPHSQ